MAEGSGPVSLRWRGSDGRAPPLPFAYRSPQGEASSPPRSLRGSPDHRCRSPLNAGPRHHPPPARARRGPSPERRSTAHCPARRELGRLNVPSPNPSSFLEDVASSVQSGMRGSPGWPWRNEGGPRVGGTRGVSGYGATFPTGWPVRERERWAPTLGTPSTEASRARVNLGYLLAVSQREKDESPFRNDAHLPLIETSLNVLANVSPSLTV
jgi:hypothetical protein